MTSKRDFANPEEYKVIWRVEANSDEDYREFMRADNPLIGISYTREFPSYRRFRFDAQVGDLIWVVPRGHRPGRAGELVSKCSFSPHHPRQRRKVKWFSKELYLNQDPQVRVCNSQDYRASRWEIATAHLL